MAGRRGSDPELQRSSGVHELRALGVAVTVGLIGLATAVPVVGVPNDVWLTATLLGDLEPGAPLRLAVRWDGPAGALLDVWVDLDGDGDPGPGELLVLDRALDPGIDVVALEVPPDGHAIPEGCLRVRVCARSPADSSPGECVVTAIDDGCAWQPGLALTGPDRPVRAMAVYDDGSGPALYAGGDLVTAGGVIVNGIARWDGSTWSPLTGSGGTGIFAYSAATVRTLAVFDDGTGPALYVGGSFMTAGGVAARNIARWDGSSWSPLGAGITGGDVVALAVYDDGNGPALYAGGWFTYAGGVLAPYIAKWDGTTWSPLAGPSGAGTNAGIEALAVYDDGTGSALYAGGTFSAAGGLTVGGIARWDGNAWSPLGGPPDFGTNGWVYALAVYDSGTGVALFAGGYFTTAGGVTTNFIARWDGGVWSPLEGPSGTGTSLTVSTLAVYDDGTGPALFAGGVFANAGGVSVNYVAGWDGTAWSALSGPSATGVDEAVYALAVYDHGSGPVLYAGGPFVSAGGLTANFISGWDGTAWSPLGGTPGSGMNDPVSSLALFDAGSGPALYAGGVFTLAGGVTVNRVARWDGSAWSPLGGPSGPGMDDVVNALALFDDGSGPALYAGGAFATAGGVAVHGIARWDGSSWSSLPGPSDIGVVGWVYALEAFDDGTGPALYVGGYFLAAGGVRVNHIARWDGATWSRLGGPSEAEVNGPVHALEVFDDGTGPALYVGGSFSTVGGVRLNRVARWDGISWSPLTGPSETGVSARVNALAVYDDGGGPALYAGGSFESAGGGIVNQIARWDGASWSALTGPYGVGVGGQSSAVHALAAYDNGSVSALYAGGDFTTAGGVTAGNVARWDGSAWSALSGSSARGTDDEIRALAVFDDGEGPALYAGGPFTTAGGIPSSRIAAWRCDPSFLFGDGFEARTTIAWSVTVP